MTKTANPDLARSCTDLVLLTLLQQEPMYSYQILTTLQDRGNGEFRFKRPFWGSFRILAKKDRLSTGEHQVRAGRSITLTIREAANLFGLVRFQGDSRPIVGATVTVRVAGKETIQRRRTEKTRASLDK